MEPTASAAGNVVGAGAVQSPQRSPLAGEINLGKPGSLSPTSGHSALRMVGPASGVPVVIPGGAMEAASEAGAGAAQAPQRTPQLLSGKVNPGKSSSSMSGSVDMGRVQAVATLIPSTPPLLRKRTTDKIGRGGSVLRGGSGGKGSADDSSAAVLTAVAAAMGSGAGADSSQGSWNLSVTESGRRALLDRSPQTSVDDGSM